MVTNNPERQLVPGVTAHQLQKWRNRCTTATLIVLAITFVCSVSGVPQSWFTTFLLFCFGVTGLPVIVLIGSVPKREKVERQAGYTTLRLGDKDLLQRDPYMGHIIRLAGSPYIDPQRFAEILKATKAKAAHTEVRQ